MSRTYWIDLSVCISKIFYNNVLRKVASWALSTTSAWNFDSGARSQPSSTYSILRFTRFLKFCKCFQRYFHDNYVYLFRKQVNEGRVGPDHTSNANSAVREAAPRKEDAPTNGTTTDPSRASSYNLYFSNWNWISFVFKFIKNFNLYWMFTSIYYLTRILQRIFVFSQHFQVWWFRIRRWIPGS